MGREVRRGGGWQETGLEVSLRLGIEKCVRDARPRCAPSEAGVVSGTGITHVETLRCLWLQERQSGCGDHEGGQDGAALFSAETDDSFPRWMESSSELFTNLQSWLPSGAPSVSAEKTDLSLFSQMHLWEVREISEIFLQNHTRLLD